LSSAAGAHGGVIIDELDLLEALVPLRDARILEAGCGAAHLARKLLCRHAQAEVVGIEVDERQLAKNLAQPQDRLRFERAGAEAIPFPDQSFDGALMLKSLHHVPVESMDRALGELHRVLRCDGWLYVSEPVYAGALNELVRLFNDEGRVRSAAQAALDRALASGAWQQVAEQRFSMPVHFADFDDFERRMMRPTYADHRIDDTKLRAVRELLEPQLGADGVHFERPMHLRLLRRQD
jgi:SAM-dependent methyltransferase